MSTYADASLIYYPSGYKAGKAYSLKPTDGSGDLTFTRASTATRVNSAGLIESVATGVPRIDFTSGCGKLLLEPQRSNSALYSSEFDNAYWVKSNATITANSTTSPDGTTNADTFLKTSALNTVSQVSKGIITSTGTYTFSVFLKDINSENVLLRLDANGNTCNTTFTFASKTFVSSGANFLSASYQELTNGWFRLMLTGNVTATNFVQAVTLYSNAINSSLYLYGFQVEAGSYPTSYIPTTTTAVTRVADSANKSGISSLIGQTQGTIFFELVIGASDSSSVSRNIGGISDGTGSNRIEIYRFNNTIQYDNITLGANQFSGIVFTLANFNTPLKIAISYSLNNVKTFINGVLVNTDVTALIPACSNLQVGVGRGGSAPYGGLVQSSMLFPTAKSDAELIALTTI